MVELVLKARGLRITDQVRQVTEHKLAKIGRHEPKLARLEVELIEEHNPRLADGSHRVEVVCEAGRRTYRAQGAGPDVESALDQVVDRLERQIATKRGKLRARWTRRANRLESAVTSPPEAGSSA
jgi:ribosomal subunit interface protein